MMTTQNHSESEVGYSRVVHAPDVPFRSAQEMRDSWQASYKALSLHELEGEIRALDQRFLDDFLRPITD